MLSIDLPFQVSGLMSEKIQNIIYKKTRKWSALVVGRAGLDLYPQPSGSKTKLAESFASDVGGSGGNIAIAMKRSGGNIGLISALSDDPVGSFVKNRLIVEGIDIHLLQTTRGNERTSLAIAEERPTDCEVVIYRNNPADLQIVFNKNIELAILNSSNLVVTGTSLIDDQSREQVLKMMDFAKKNEVENLEYVEQNNIKVFIDPKATMFLIGSEMDYSSDKLASRFVFKNPNEKSTCGCGESFGI